MNVPHNRRRTKVNDAISNIQHHRQGIKGDEAADVFEFVELAEGAFEPGRGLDGGGDGGTSQVPKVALACGSKFVWYQHAILTKRSI